MESEIHIQPMMIQKWMNQNYDSSRVSELLQEQGHSEEVIQQHLQAFKKALWQKRQFSSFTYCGFGAFVGFIGCLLALINPFPDLYYWFLYGLTTVAAGLIFWGLYLLLEE